MKLSLDDIETLAVQNLLRDLARLDAEVAALQSQGIAAQRHVLGMLAKRHGVVIPAIETSVPPEFLPNEDGTSTLTFADPPASPNTTTPPAPILPLAPKKEKRHAKK